LKRKEADIDDWQKNKVAKARQKMRKIEVRFLTTDHLRWIKSFPNQSRVCTSIENQMELEKKRAEAAGKMQKKIEQAQRKADKKKVKEQAAIGNQIDGVERALEKMSKTGKLPWSLAFL
jgi:putative cell wall-binding protein